MLLRFVSVSVVSALALLGYLQVARREGQVEPVLLSTYIPFALVAPVPFLAIGARAVAKVRARLQAALDRGAGPGDLPVADVRFFLRMHRWLIAAKMAMWTTFALGWPALTFSLGVEQEYDADQSHAVSPTAGSRSLYRIPEKRSEPRSVSLTTSSALTRTTFR